MRILHETMGLIDSGLLERSLDLGGEHQLFQCLQHTISDDIIFMR